MPRTPRGRPRGRHRRPKTAHLPLAAGSLAVATATAGALVLSGSAPGAPTAQDAGRSVADRLVTAHTEVLDPDAVAAALALRSQETTERSMQRAQLSASVTRAQAEKAASSGELAAAATPVEAPPAPVWVIPLENYELTSLFGPRWGRRHNGIDLAAPWGTPIRAMSDGEVVSTDYEGGFGNKTVVRHPDGTETWYCHQTSFEVRSGTVTAGQVIGYVGSTGNSTGPHLHLEVHPGGGEPINPLTWIRDTLGLAI